MREIDNLLFIYGESHQNRTNKLIHWICVPSIMFSLVGLIMHISFFAEKSMFSNWATLILILALIYYFKLSFKMFLGFLPISYILLFCNWELILFCKSQQGSSVITLLLVFIIAWIGQFIGHKIEGKKPSFLQDLQFLLIGPAWLLHFVFQKLGVSY